ncbi:hypothetical protein FGIG_03224 [Fasciola gigantica]|uniref:Apple domain-containing protein n=1 Tax=Fasciola gigantica TaxID=46835 RepID=A0A504YVW9_FASGI|nr:hypothetical protein FGIG_03224 [Fasciola gigantica]
MPTILQTLTIISFFSPRIVCINNSIVSTNTELVLNRTEYCKAHRECFLKGQSKKMIGYMLGEEVFNFLSKNAVTSDLWINLHVLLEQTNKSGLKKWIYGEKNSGATKRGIQDVTGKQLNRGDRVAIFTTKRQIARANTINGNYAFACAFSSISSTIPTTRHELFRQQLIGSSKLYAFSDDTKGCFEKYLYFTKIECALKCHLDMVCRSFYFNTVSPTCIHALYVDSLLTRSHWQTNSKSWQRISRPTWSLRKDGN